MVLQVTKALYQQGGWKIFTRGMSSRWLHSVLAAGAGTAVIMLHERLEEGRQNKELTHVEKLGYSKGGSHVERLQPSQEAPSKIERS